MAATNGAGGPARLDRLELLPVGLWGLHPLYYCAVRMLCGHVEHCVRGAEPNREDFHILYNQHPITKVEVAGVVTWTKIQRDSKQIFGVDDGTGTVQCAIPLYQFGGTAPTHHRRPCVGESVVVCGKLTFAFAQSAGSLFGRCREVWVSSIRQTTSEDELSVQWLHTMKLHAQVYCKTAAELMPSLPPTLPCFARMTPLSAAAARLRPQSAHPGPSEGGGAAAPPAAGGGGGGAAPPSSLLLAPAERGLYGGVQAAVVHGIGRSMASESSAAAAVATAVDGDGAEDGVGGASMLCGLVLDALKAEHPHIAADAAQRTQLGLDDAWDAGDGEAPAPSGAEHCAEPAAAHQQALPAHFTALDMLHALQRRCSAEILEHLAGIFADTKTTGVAGGSAVVSSPLAGVSLGECRALSASNKGDDAPAAVSYNCSILLQWIDRALQTLLRGGYIYQVAEAAASVAGTAARTDSATGAPPAPPPLAAAPAAAAAVRYCAMSTAHTLAPAVLRAMMSRKAAAATATAAAAAADAAQPWSLWEITHALARQPATRFVRPETIRECLARLQAAGRVVAVGGKHYELLEVRGAAMHLDPWAALL